VTATDERTIRLSNGRAVEVPVGYEATVAGVVAVADYDALDRATPERLRPVRIGPTEGVVTLVGINYGHIGDFDPYGEFAVIVPVSRHSVAGAPLSAGTVGGWVHWLPVTTEPARLLGVDGWGFPKSVADITFETATVDADGSDGGRRVRRCRVAVGGELVLTLSVDLGRPARLWAGRTLSVDTATTSYTEQDGQLLATTVDLDGATVVRPLDSGVSLALGPHERADDLRALGVGSRLLGRQVLGSFWCNSLSGAIHRGRRV
jgi:hypothetical protein